MNNNLCYICSDLIESTNQCSQLCYKTYCNNEYDENLNNIIINNLQNYVDLLKEDYYKLEENYNKLEESKYN